jgi:hypothetical protein
MTTEAPIQDDIREDWKATITNEHNVSLDDLKFVFAQAEKRLDDSIKNFDATTTKSISFITLSTTLLTALTAYLFVNLDPEGTFDPKMLTVFVCCAYTAFVLFRFISIILPKYYQPIGSYPQDLYVDMMFTDEIKHEGMITTYLYLGEIENYNCRIAQNSKVNASRLKIFNQSALMISLMPIVGLTTYSLVLLLSLLWSL